MLVVAVPLVTTHSVICRHGTKQRSAVSTLYSAKMAFYTGQQLQTLASSKRTKVPGGGGMLPSITRICSAYQDEASQK